MKQNNYAGALQHSIASRFTARSTAVEIITGTDLTGKTAIVTGASTGIGLETVKVLAGAGATVFALARDTNKAKRNLEGVANISVHELDMMKPASIDAFANAFIASGQPLHLLINNAGIMWVPLKRDERGIESQLATNHVGPFHLTARLWPALKAAGGARVVNLSSLGHQFAGVDFHDPNFLHRPYETLAAYGQSKTACNLFTVELDRRAEEYGVRVYAVHPGSIAGTELGRDASVELFQQMGFLDASGNLRPELLAGLKTVPQGAATTIWAATSPALNTIGGVLASSLNQQAASVYGC